VRAHRRQGRIREQRFHLLAANHKVVLLVSGGNADLDGADLVHDAPQCRHNGLPSHISGVLEVEYHPAGRADGDAPVGELLLVVPWFTIPGS
jgi:hypothetical protein